MFLSDLTVLDHAYIDANGFVVGGSFNPCVNVSGKIDEVERVVVDFSAIKKNLKALIDDKHTGYDHKLWIIEGFSNTHDIVLTEEIEGLEDVGILTITTPEVTLKIPRSAIKVVKRINNMTPDYSYEYIGKSISQYLTERLAELYPNVNIEAEVFITEHFHSYYPASTDGIITDCVPFRYTHGLRNSTSWGCQNIAHGHLSYIRLICDKINETEFDNYDDYLFTIKKVEELANSIATDLNNAVFIDKENVVTFNEHGVQIEYNSRNRGTFAAIYSHHHKTLILDTETTIEFIVEYVKTQYLDMFKDLGVTSFMVSEGLSKGAIAYV